MNAMRRESVDALARRVVIAYEDARQRGLCEDGAIEAAAGPLRETNPQAPPDVASPGTDPPNARAISRRLADAAGANLDLARRLLRTIPAARATQQPGGMMNHPAWTLAHLIHYQPAILALANGQAVDDPTEHPDASRFDAGSTPVPEPDAYPAWLTLQATYLAGHARILGALAVADPTSLATAPGLPRWAASFTDTADALAYLLIHHEAVHFGELIAWCHAAGLGGALASS